MKKNKFLVVIIAVIIFLPFLGRFIWALQKSRQMEIMIVNKTVLGDSHNEVKSLSWVLNFNKILKTDNTRYNFNRDYYGYHPDAPAEEWKIRSFKLADLPDIREKYCALFYLDNQGVKMTSGDTKPASAYYGGFNQNDYLLLREMMNAGKLVIAEYNFFSSPTEELVRYNTEQLLDIHCLGWRGKYFASLDPEKLKDGLDPVWIDRYKEYNNRNWDFSGPGIILINEKQNRLLILPRNQCMEKDYPVVVTGEKYAESLHLCKENAFTGWFAVVYQGENEVISTIDLNLNEQGKAIMMKNGLGCRFPAVIKSSLHPFYYLAGDFSKTPVSLVWSRVRLVNDFMRTVSGKMSGNPHVFFQAYYVPLMSAVLKEHYAEMKQAGV